MKTMNKVQLIGYLGRDPELVVFPSGSKLAKIRLATTEFIGGEEKEDRKVTTWHNVTAWDNLADQAKLTMIKGSHISVEGKLRYREYTNKEGTKVQAIEIIANQFIDLDR